MHINPAHAAAAIAAVLSVMAGKAAHATEGALGRTILGSLMQARPGVVAPIPLTAVNVTSFYFAGDLGAAVDVPQAGLITANADAKAWFTPLTVLKVWDARSSEWRFASAITMPVLWLEATGSVVTPLGTRRIRQSNFGIYDIAITPVIIGHRLSPMLQASARLPVDAPTGSYATGRLNNLSANYWTVAPTLALTRLSANGTAELSGQLAVQVHSRNKATDYESAPVLIFDALAVKRFASGLGAGVALSLVQQLGDDTGRLAVRLNGFRGRDFGLGPYASYTTKVGAAPLDLILRWVPSIESKRRLAGNTLMLTASMPVAARIPGQPSPAAP